MLPGLLRLTGVQDGKHRPMLYPPSSKLFVHFVAYLTCSTLSEAWEAVRSDPKLRELGRFERASRKAQKQMKNARGGKRRNVAGDPFPHLETIRQFPEWMARAERALAETHDPNRDMDAFDPFWRIRRVAHQAIPAAAAIEHDATFSLLAVDGAGVASPLRWDGKKRHDGSARGQRKRSDRWYGRVKVTVVSAPLSMILDSEIFPGSEIAEMAYGAVPRVRGNVDAINDACHAANRPAAAIDRPAWFGDGAFNKTVCMKSLHAHGFDGLFRHNHDGIRLISHTRIIHTADHGPLELVVCNDGTHLCPCQASKLPPDHPNPKRRKDHRRVLAQLEPMEQLQGRVGEYVMMRCIAPECPRFKTQIRVPYPKTSDGRTNLTQINPIVAWDKQNRANLFLATEAIERINSALSPRATGTRRSVIPSLTRQLGDDAAAFGSLLTDLRINLQILNNLEHGTVETTYGDVDETIKAAHAKALQARRFTHKDTLGAPIPLYHLMDGVAKRLQAGRPPNPATAGRNTTPLAA